MIKHLLSQLDNTNGAILAFANILPLCLLDLLFWTLRQENKKRYEEAGSLPLNDGVANE